MEDATPPKPTDGEGAINSSQLLHSQAVDGPLSGAPLVPGCKPNSMMPPPSISSMTSGMQGAGMTAIREERENSQA